MKNIKSQYIGLIPALLLLFCFGLPGWAAVQLIGGSVILSAFGKHPFVVATLASSILIGITLLINKRVKPKLPSALKLAYPVILVYVLITFGSLLPATYLLNKGLPSIRQVAFSSTFWKADTYERAIFPKKVNMIEDLKGHHLRVGLSRQEIIELLGNCTEGKAECMINLGPQRDSIMPVDDSHLTLNFANDHLQSWEEWSD